MTTKKTVWFRFFPNDFIGGTWGMTPGAVGCYMRLLCYQFANGAIPNDGKQMSRICGCSLEDFNGYWEEIRTKFSVTECGEGLVNDRLDSETTRSKNIASRNRTNGGNGGRPKNPNETQKEPKRNPNETQDPPQPLSGSGSGSGSYSDSGSESESSGKERMESAFDWFWKIVHRKTGKEEARKAHLRAVKRVAADKGIAPESAAEFIRLAMIEFCATPEARPKDRTPIHPSTWLNQGRYDDDRGAWQGTQKQKSNF